ncbi:avirulence protein, partial [Xanthomonas campestris pv. plantaginis]|nr:avirulence protein [Xanthomonas campestris pv. plantaginis]
MGLCNSKPSVAGSPARYTTRTTEQATPSESSSPSRRDSSSSSTNALRDALPSPPRRAASPKPQGSPSRQGAGWSGHEGFSSWSEYQGNFYDSA